MKAKISASKSRVALAMFVACVCALPVRAQSSGASEVISDPFPLSEATRRLGDRYAVAVTYEDAILLRMDEIVLIGKRPEEPFSYRAVRNPITMPEELTPAVTPKLSSEVLGKLIGAFSATNPNGPRFRVLESKYGWHIVPESVRGDSGQFVRAKTPLDAAVSVPVGERLADEHLNLLAEALTRASGIEVQLIAPNCNGLYAANGLIPPKLLTLGIPPGSAIESSPGIPPGQFSPEARRPYSFSWGATGVTGREALLSLLEGSASTLSWRVNCHSLPANGKSHCWLNIGPLQTTVLGFDGRPEKRTLSYDRCTKCPPLPPPPPTGRRQP